MLAIGLFGFFAKEFNALGEGVETMNPNEVVSARKLYGSEGYYDSYNSAILVSAADTVPVYHKSRLVPGVERIPFPALTHSLNNLAIDLGGTTGSLGIQENREVFPVPGSGIVAAPIICYESIYGAFTGDYVKQGANLLCVVTNDGWWEIGRAHV